MTPPRTGISVLIITRGRPGQLSDCLRSLLSAGGNPEVLVGIDGDDPVSEAAAGNFAPAARTVRLPRSCRGEARNVLAGLARGRWLCFLDDDIIVPTGYIERLESLITENGGAAVFGGGQGLFAGARMFERCVYALLSSPWGGGPFTERFRPVSGTRAAGHEKFVLCNLTVDREVLSAHGLSFEGHLSSAEENLLLSRLAARGVGMVLSGDLNLVHRRREELYSFAAQVFSSGRGRAQMTALRPGAATLFTLLPPAALATGSITVFYYPLLAAGAAAAYAAISLGAAALSSARPAEKPLVGALFPVLHATYAAGWIFGAGESLMEKLRGGVRPRRCRCEERP